MSIYEKVIKLCAEHQTTKTALEEACGFSQNSINKWKDSSPSIKNLVKVADFFGVSVDCLLGREFSHTEKAVPMERPESDIATIDNIKSLLAENNGLDFIERLYKELQEKQRVFVLTWLIGYAQSQGIAIKL